MSAKIHSILLVDDNRTAVLALQRLLQRHGYEVKTAYDGEVAIRAAGKSEPDAVILDLDLPKKNGYEVARAMKRDLHSGALLIALSGHGQAEDKRMAQAAGFDYHLTKPILVSEIERLFDAPRTTQVLG